MVRHMNAAERREKVAARLAARSRRTATKATARHAAAALTAAADQDLFEKVSHGRAVLAFPGTYQDRERILAAARAAAAEWRRRFPGRLPAPAKKWARVAHGIAHELFAAGSTA